MQDYVVKPKQMEYLERFAKDESVPMYKGKTQRVECWLTRFTVNNLLFICKAKGIGVSMAIAQALNKAAAAEKAGIPQDPNENRVYAKPARKKKEEKAPAPEAPEGSHPEIPQKESPPLVRDLAIPNDG